MAALPLFAVLGVALAAPAGAHAAGPTATFSKSSDWGSGFVGHYAIHNRGTTAMDGWRLEFDLPAGETITSAWSGRLSSLGSHYVLTDEDWTRRIAPGASVQVGFEGSYLTSFGAPANCRLNGQPCADDGSGPPPPDTTPPSAPTGLAASGATATTVSLGWHAASDEVGVTGYSVYRGSTKVATTTSTSATVTGLTPSTDYSFTVRATDAAGNLSPASQPASATTAADGAGTATATFSKVSDWGSGFVGEWTIRNDGAATMNGWRLEFELAAGETITSAWSGKLTSEGDHHVLTDEDWTRTIAPGASVKVGVQGTYATTFTPPAHCALNSRPCTAPDTSAPTAPTGLVASGATASTVALRWNAASDDVGVTGYSVYDGATKLATTTTTSTTVTGLSPATTYGFAVRAADAAGNLSPASNLVTASTAAAGDGDGSGSTPATFAPYVDMTLSSDSLAAMMADSGVSRFTLAFIVSGSACKASWGGYYGIDDGPMTRRIADLEAAGGEAIVSFGGAINQELAQTCTSVDALAAQYQAVIDQYGIRELDFDIEGAAQRDTAALERRAKAIARVQAAGRAAGKPVHVSLTLPVMPTGLTHDGLNVIRSAIAGGVDVETVNVMAMDYFDPALSYTDRMGDYAIQAATSTHDQLAQLYPDRSDAQLWRMIGVTPMLGINDNPDEIFTTADAAQLATFAKQKGLGRLAMWSMNRDRPCPTPSRWTSNTCSGVLDGPWAFSDAFR